MTGYSSGMVNTLMNHVQKQLFFLGGVGAGGGGGGFGGGNGRYGKTCCV